IPFTQYRHVIVCMSSDDVSQGPYCKRIPTGKAATLPGFSWQVAEESNRGLTDLAEFVNVLRPGNRLSAGCINGGLLLKAGQRTLEPSGKPQGTEDEHSLGIVHMAPCLADAPLVRGVAVE